MKKPKKNKNIPIFVICEECGHITNVREDSERIYKRGYAKGYRAKVKLLGKEIVRLLDLLDKSTYTG